jgi:threonine/homoserine/homoserine lactone efflux protein
MSMTLSLTAHGVLALALATLLFAAIPGPGVTAVVAQALGRGLKPALLWSAGLVLGDAAYLLLALFGMGWAAQQLGGAFIILKWLGAGYLVFLGLRHLLASEPERPGPDSGAQAPRTARTFAGGFCVSVSNPKVMAFYCGFLPAFVDLHSLSGLDAACVAGIILPLVYAVIAGYAWLASRGRNLARSGRAWKYLSRGAGAAMIGAGAAVAAR